jgi:hypothetical protein
MSAAYENALRTVAESYEAMAASYGGRSLSRIATIVVNSGSFFDRLKAGKTFSVHNLERFAAWFRDPINWPDGFIPQDAVAALASIGRPPLGDDSMPHVCGTNGHAVTCDRQPISQRSAVR